MSDPNTKTEGTSPENQPEKTYEVDLHTIGNLVFKSSPALFVAIILTIVGSIAFSISKYYELKELITTTNHSIELLHNDVKSNLELINYRIKTESKQTSSDLTKPQ